MQKYQVIAEFRDKIADKVRKVGEVIEVDDERAEQMVKKGVAKVASVVAQLTGNAGGGQGDDDLDEQLVSLGGGYYQLPNGEKVRGKEAAQKALQELQDGDAK